MKRTLKSGESIRIGRVVAECPECGGRLFMWCDEWECDTGKPVGIHLDCEHEPDFIDGRHRAGEFEHRWWQSDWQPVIDRVEKWARRHVRIV